jgi:outer membrane protein OmpA-like peptidoglycan-associated protein
VNGTTAYVAVKAASGYGETLPVASNSSERGRQLNRRVTLLLKAKAT